ncbi:uncharacterized protein EAF01_009432 [Botrytis porri]|uniref:Uncharacterized protein n=1 Tax=Botrytis porri TaxID=87229 RepID=A0A4Z1K7A6_9HELO|nr:uncharacterized protein EAF01_009432 [Botrytis porri]KAF7895470.1 hypothetical protein EAF01_009432 [Botrytis porri]TGO81354.1 hypothetical protein BPOR_1191g00020 [Botrytis porri]
MQVLIAALGFNQTQQSFGNTSASRHLLRDTAFQSESCMGSGTGKERPSEKEGLRHDDPVEG